MTTANTIPGEGTIFQVKVSTVYTTIAQVTEVDGPEMLVAAIDKTNLLSALKLSRGSKLPDPSKVSIKILFDVNDTVSQNLIWGDLNSTPGTSRDFKIIFNDGDTTPSSATFSGFFTSGKLNGIKVEENLGMDVEMKPTTIITFTAGTP